MCSDRLIGLGRTYHPKKTDITELWHVLFELDCVESGKGKGATKQLLSRDNNCLVNMQDYGVKLEKQN